MMAVSTLRGLIMKFNYLPEWEKIQDYIRLYQEKIKPSQLCLSPQDFQKLYQLIQLIFEVDSLYDLSESSPEMRECQQSTFNYCYRSQTSHLVSNTHLGNCFDDAADIFIGLRSFFRQSRHGASADSYPFFF